MDVADSRVRCTRATGSTSQELQHGDRTLATTRRGHRWARAVADPPTEMEPENMVIGCMCVYCERCGRSGKQATKSARRKMLSDKFISRVMEIFNFIRCALNRDQLKGSIARHATICDNKQVPTCSSSRSLCQRTSEHLHFLSM